MSDLEKVLAGLLRQLPYFGFDLCETVTDDELPKVEGGMCESCALEAAQFLAPHIEAAVRDTFAEMYEDAGRTVPPEWLGHHTDRFTECLAERLTDE